MVIKMAKANQLVINTQESVAPLGVIALEGAAELGKKIDRYLREWAQEGGLNADTYLIENECPRFPRATERD